MLDLDIGNISLGEAQLLSLARVLLVRDEAKVAMISRMLVCGDGA